MNQQVLAGFGLPDQQQMLLVTEHEKVHDQQFWPDCIAYNQAAC
jgi:hypothetical protein